jgi:hypothetical protein
VAQYECLSQRLGRAARHKGMYLHSSTCQYKCKLASPLPHDAGHLGAYTPASLSVAVAAFATWLNPVSSPAGASVQQLARLAGHPHLGDSQQAGAACSVKHVR